jgi:hypothetical protein
LFLRRPEIAEMVVAALWHGERALHRYELHSFVVMTKPIFFWASTDRFGRRRALIAWSEVAKNLSVFAPILSRIR